MWEELKRPATAIAVALAFLGLISGGLVSWYFYVKSEKAGRIALLVDQVQVFDKARLGQVPLRVVDSTGSIITENVFAANVTIWNAGNAEIKKTDVRKPFRLIVTNVDHLLDFSVVEYSHENIDDFNLRQMG